MGKSVSTAENLGPAMSTQAATEDRETIATLQRIFAETLFIAPPSEDTDLLEEGLIDSLSLVNLIVELEGLFQLDILNRDFEVESFRSLESIAEFLASCRAA